MTTWHRLGTKAELLERVPFAVKVDRYAVAVFFHEGQFQAIGDSCNHKGGPLCEGRLRGEFVMCPWQFAGRHRPGLPKFAAPRA